MDQKDIETIAISKVKESLTVNAYLSPFLNENDKEPSWDGQIYLYKKEGKRKADFEGRVSVQVKGKETKAISKNQIKYPVQISDLKNYATDGGVIFFVVYLKDAQNYKIYYDTLEPIKLNKILHEVGKEQKTKTITLKSFPKKKQVVRNIFRNFYLNEKRQRSFTSDSSIYLQNIEKDILKGKYKMILTGYGLYKEKNNFLDLDNFSKYNTPYFYLQEKESGLPPIPLDPDNISVIQYSEQNAEISIKNTIFYKKIRRTFDKSDKDKVLVYFSRHVYLILNKKSSSLDFRFKESNLLREAALDLRFVVGVIENKGFSMDGTWFDFSKSINSNSVDMKRIYEDFKRQNETVQALDTLGINKDIDIEKLSSQDLKNLDIIWIGIGKKEIVHGIKEKKSGFVKFSFDKVNVMLFLYYDSREKGHKVINPFNNLSSNEIDTVIKTEDNEYIQVSPFVILTEKDLESIDNIDFSKITSSFKKLRMTKEIFSGANELLLAMLLAFDSIRYEEEKKAKALIDSALDLASWLLEINKQNNYDNSLNCQVNYLQIVRRIGSLTTEQKKELVFISEQGELSLEEKIAVNILLESKNVTNILLAELKEDNEKFETFKSWPIWNLVTE